MTVLAKYFFVIYFIFQEVKLNQTTSFLPLSKNIKMDPCVPIPLDEKTLEDIVEKAKDYCLMHGKYIQVLPRFQI